MVWKTFFAFPFEILAGSSQLVSSNYDDQKSPRPAELHGEKKTGVINHYLVHGMILQVAPFQKVTTSKGDSRVESGLLDHVPTLPFKGSISDSSGKKQVGKTGSLHKHEYVLFTHFPTISDSYC